MNYGKLDNPVWYSLSETHNRFSINYEGVKFYDPEYCAFGGVATNKNIASCLDEYAAMAGDFFIVGDKPAMPDRVTIKKELVCLQMVIADKITTAATEDIVALTTKHADALYDLVNLVQPGYFKIQTPLLGNYFGVFKNGQLVSATGERMVMDSFVEVSAIVTHPAFTGKGYAKQLIAHAVHNIFSEGKQPYLHVAETNAGAIALYEKLGFATRRKISFWNIGR